MNLGKALVVNMENRLCMICCISLSEQQEHGTAQARPCCSRQLHTKCFQYWLEIGDDKCPNCRKKLDRNALSPYNPPTRQNQDDGASDRFAGCGSVQQMHAVLAAYKEELILRHQQADIVRNRVHEARIQHMKEMSAKIEMKTAIEMKQNAIRHVVRMEAIAREIEKVVEEVREKSEREKRERRQRLEDEESMEKMFGDRRSRLPPTPQSSTCSLM